MRNGSFCLHMLFSVSGIGWTLRGLVLGTRFRLGQVSAEHPLLGAAVALADGGGWLFTGRISLQSHPWLADHVVMGSVLLPGTAFLELALRAGNGSAAGVVGELTLQAPLVFEGERGVALQVVVGEADELGRSVVGCVSRVWRVRGRLVVCWVRLGASLLGRVLDAAC